MKKFLSIPSLLFALLLFVPTVCAQVNFDAWLGMDDTAARVGRPFKVGLYVKNTGVVVDDYNISFVSSGSLSVRLESKEINETYPSDVKGIYVEIIPIRSGDHTVTFTVTSKGDTSKSKDLQLTVHAYVLTGIPEMSVVSVVFILFVSLVVLVSIRRVFYSS